MSSLSVLIQILGAVVMLLWGIRSVRTGVVRAYGGILRKKLGAAVENRFSAFGIGLGVTALLQSSTATALIVSSFAAKGLMATAPALAIMLGADVGTTLVAQVLSTDISWLSPLLFIVGYILHSRAGSYQIKQQGRILFGLGMILLSLSLIKSASIPLRESDVLIYLINAFEHEYLVILVVSAIITWAAHSSLAMVLFITSLASVHIISMDVAIMMVLGANLGGTIPPIMTTLRSGAVGLRVTVGNALFKLVGCIAIFPFIGVMTGYLLQLDPDITRTIVNFHTLLNIGVALFFVGLTNLVAPLLTWAIPSKPANQDQSAPQYLDDNVVGMPELAIAGASRELFRMGEIVESALAHVRNGIELDELSSMDIAEQNRSIVSRLHEKIKLYVVKLNRGELSDDDSNQAAYVFNATTNLDHIADIVDNISATCRKRIQANMSFSNEGIRELNEICNKVELNLKIAILMLHRHDESLFNEIKQSTVTIKASANASRNAHIHRMGDGRTDSIETSELHIDILRDLLRINDHIIAATSASS